MAIEKPLTPTDIVEIDSELESDLDIEIINPDAVTINEEDGSMTIVLDEGMQEMLIGPDHDSNLAEFIDDSDLEDIGSDLIESFMGDRESRKEWAQAYVKGLDLLGLKIEERDQPWPGACGVFHPVLTESVVRFQAQAITEVFPASGPVRTKIMGTITDDKARQASRVETEMNYMTTEVMTEYRDEFEQLLFKLPLAGSAFKKVYYDPMLERPVAAFVPAEDFVISYGASDLATAERYTHVMKKTPNEVLKYMVSGFYRDVDLPDPSAEYSDIEEKYDEIEGESNYSIEDDDRYTILEIHADIDLPGEFADPDGIARPYVVTVDKSSRTVLSIRRNWYEDDEKKSKRLHFVHYPYLPGLGFYGIGLIHLIGGLAKSATSILRQLVDAGTLANLPAGLKARGLRIKGDDSPLMPGEFRDVDIPGGAIRDNIYPLPYKEPSTVLYQLLGNIVDESRRIGSVADVDISSANPNAPVGTTLALLERSMKVMSGVQARLHAALRKELRILSRIIHDYMPAQYAYEMEGDFNRIEDFDGRVDVIPVSDPNAATMSQKVMQYQAALQLAQQAPQIYDLGRLHRQMLEVLGIQDADKIVKLEDEIEPTDPVTENMKILQQEGVKAFAYQDHEAHIQVHMAMLNDPKIKELVGQSPFAPVIQKAMIEHITEHVAFQYRKEIEGQLGVPLPDPDEPLPEDVEFSMSSTVAKAAEKLLQQDKAEMAQLQAQRQQQDPLTQIQQRELALKEAEFQHKRELDFAKLQLDSQSKTANIMTDQERIASQERQEGARLGVKIATEKDRIERKDQLEGAKLGVEIAKSIAQNTKEQ
tara:strand:- start:3281 stop:5737 length:2457 start_codon:yes stop_codon:yes gene_type:complete